MMKDSEMQKKERKCGIMVNYSINAVAENEIEEFLKTIEEYDKIKLGQVFCKYCAEKITFNNIYSLFPKDNEVCYCCKKEKCITEMTWE